MSITTAILHWLQLNYIEFAATLTGLLYVVYAIKQKRIVWLFGILSSGLFVWVFYHADLFAYGTLYIGYVIIGIYGWYNWSRKIPDDVNKKGRISIHKATAHNLWSYIIISVLLTVPIYIILKKYTDSDLPFPDAILTALGLVATWMLTQKLIEQWLFWIAIDLFSFFVMIYKGLYPSSVLFIVYTLLAVKGFFEWKKELITPA
jgi:nicotinamide mononucleotide transporter